MKKERPMLMNTEMVKATIKEIKTKTRRTTGLERINVEPDKWKPRVFDEIAEGRECYGPYHYQTKKGAQRVIFDSKDELIELADCPFGKTGDILYVRENWRVKSWCPDDGEMEIGFDTGDDESITCYELDEDLYNRLWVQSCDDLADAGYTIGPDENYSDYDEKVLRLRPSIHMPKEAARLWLEIVSIRVERLNDITEKDAIAEGVKTNSVNGTDEAGGEYWNYNAVDYDDFPCYSAKESFESLWESINGSESWKANPWVWVIAFDLIERPEL
jgi:hypothetical protein